MNDHSFRIIQKAAYILLFLILFFYAIIMAKHIFIPVTLSFLFATLMFPMANFLEVRARFPRNLAILLSVLLFVGVFFVIGSLGIQQVERLIEDFPLLKLKALQNLDYIKQVIEDNFGIESKVQHRWLKDQVNFMFESGSEFMQNTLRATTGTLFVLLIIPVLMFYMLAFREQFQKFIIIMVPEGRKIRTIRVMRQVSTIIQRYITGVFTVILLLCILNSAGLAIIGLQYAILFGVLSAFFNIIPYFGNWIGAAIPFTFAVLTGESPSLAFSVILVYIVIQFLEHNILTPNITGGYVRLNPLACIIGIIVGGLVWGVAGMLIVIPFLATLKILFDNVESLKPYAYLLSNTHSQVIKVNIWPFRRKMRKRKPFVPRGEGEE